MENALLYTFSTIAQTLGGAIGLLAAFVLYRFQSLDRALARDGDTMRKNLLSRGVSVAGMERLLVEEKYHQVLADWVANGHEPIRESDRLKHGLAQRDRMIEGFKGAAFSTGAAIMFPIIALPFSHFLSSQKGLAITVIAAGIAMFAVSLWSYWLIISVALGIRAFRTQIAPSTIRSGSVKK